MDREILNRLSAITAEEQAIIDGSLVIDRDLYMESEKNVVNAQKLINSGKLITIRPHTRFIHFPKHTHDYIEIVYMCAGETTHIINGNKVRLAEGETLILNQYATQEILPARETDIAVNFIVMPQFLNKAIEMMGEEETPLRRFIINCIIGSESTDGYLHYKTADVLQIQNLFENLIISFTERAPTKRKTAELTMGLLLLEFINHSDKLGYDNIKKGILIDVFKYIEEKYPSGTLSELADKLHYDVYWLSREIKRKTGKTFTDLLQEKRLLQTEYLLSNSNIPVGDIAQSVGYNNTNYFHSIFKKRFGVSPKKYRIIAKQH